MAPAWDLAKARGKVSSKPMTSPVERISGPRMESTASPPWVRKRLNGSTASLTAMRAWSLYTLASSSGSMPSALQLGDGRPEHDARRRLGERHPRRLRHERHGARRARVRLEHVQDVARERELHVHEAAHADASRERLGGDADAVEVRARQGDGRQHARGVTRVDARLLDVLHHAAEEHLLAVEERVDVDLDRVVEELVDQQRRVGGVVAHVFHAGAVVLELLAGVHDLHAAPAEHVRRPHQHGVADALGDLDRLVDAVRGAVLRGRQACRLQDDAELAPVLRLVDRLRRRCPGSARRRRRGAARG